ncbi:NAD(P)H-binding protein [Ruania alba]|uniref:NAD(P)H-binding n=1 Tax=Ruania alba TaxID=648782 RepID=A0A1H5N5D7_9MICO|nr:NAD(P)H-binding protein [Ruania alba]SEE96829.1 NAD(P)H-binding [Ruania alba]
MNVFIIGITGGVGTLLARTLRTRGDEVRGLVRREPQRAVLAAEGIDAVVGDIAQMSAEQLASAIGDADVVVFAAGSNGGVASATRAVDLDGVTKTIEAMSGAGSKRAVLLSVLPEAWRERDLTDDEEYYFAVKKQADVAMTRSELDWVILRPSLLTDDAANRRVALGPAQVHGQIARFDVAETLGALIHEPRIRRQILELDTGDVEIVEAVRRNVP